MLCPILLLSHAVELLFDAAQSLRVVGAPLARSVMFWQLVNQEKSGEIARFSP